MERTTGATMTLQSSDTLRGGLAQRRVIVTGGARGLGAAFVESLAARGAHVVIGDVLHAEGQALADRLGDDVHFMPLDLADPADIDSFVARAAQRIGGVDAVINNAAITNSGGRFADELSIETWDAVMNVNVRGTWRMCVAALPFLR